MRHVRWGYAAAAAALVVEIGIALYLHDRIVRPYGGDALAVVLVYLALRAVTRLGTRRAVSMALAVAVVIECAQAVHALRWVGLEHDRLARVVLGGQFDLTDFAAYAVGAAAVPLVEAWRARRARR